MSKNPPDRFEVSEPRYLLYLWFVVFQWLCDRFGLENGRTSASRLGVWFSPHPTGWLSHLLDITIAVVTSLSRLFTAATPIISFCSLTESWLLFAQSLVSSVLFKKKTYPYLSCWTPTFPAVPFYWSTSWCRMCNMLQEVVPKFGRRPKMSLHEPEWTSLF